MGIESALYTGVSGLDAMSQELSVIGNNISNSNTVGFKSDSVTFANLLSTSLGASSSSQAGNGVQVDSIGTDFSQGTLQTTSDPLDLAIQGNGFFTVKDASGTAYYTRAGQFSVDKNGNIVNPNGDFLQGNAALTQPVTTKTGVTAGTFGASGNINISAIGSGAPTPTANATIFANLLQSTALNDPIGGAPFTITTTNNQIVISGSALPATTVTLAPGSYSGSSLSAELTKDVNNALFAAASATFGSAAIQAAYNSSSASASYEFTINNVSASQVNFQWSSTATTASNMLGFSNINNQASTPPVPDSGISTIAAGGSASSDFQVAGFDPNDPAGAFSTAMTVYDSGGNSHLTNVYFEKVASAVGGNTWMYWAVVPSSDSASGIAQPSIPQITQEGTLNFNTAGDLVSVQQGTYNSFNFNGGVTQDQSINFDFGQMESETTSQGGSGTIGTTQYGSPSSVSNQYQDGYASGSLQSFSVSQTGIITGTFTNGQTKNIAQIQLARFNAPTELTNAGNNLFTQSAASGQPIPGLAGNAGFGSIFSSSLEESNVDLSGEFVNMITVQSAYQANAKVISTAQELFTALQNAKQ
jgi:flagellar hook protein FlgE